MRVAVILISGLAALIAAAPSPTISDAEIQAFHDLVSKSLAERESAPLLVAKDANCDDCKASYNLCVKLGTQAEGTTFHNAVCQAICQVHLCIFDWGRCRPCGFNKCSYDLFPDIPHPKSTPVLHHK